MNFKVIYNWRARRRDSGLLAFQQGLIGQRDQARRCFPANCHDGAMCAQSWGRVLAEASFGLVAAWAN